MSRDGLSLPPGVFAAAFPFHLGFDRSLRAVSVGRSLRKLIPDLAGGSLVDRWIRQVRPRAELGFEAIAANCDCLYILECARAADRPLSLRGQMFFLEDADVIVFLGSPWLSDVADLRQHRLSLSDFALHDPVGDLLHLLQVQTTALSETKLLASQVAAANERLHTQFEALKSSQSVTRAILANAVDGIVTVDRHGMIDQFNPAAERIFGYSADEIVGRTAWSLMPDADAERYHLYHRRFFDSGDERIIGSAREAVARRKDGSQFPCELSISSAEIDGEPHLVGIIRDVTQRKQEQLEVEEATSRLSALIRSLNLGVLVETETRHIALVNRTFCRMFGIDAEPEVLVGADCSRAAEDAKHLMKDPEGFAARIDSLLSQRRPAFGDELEMSDGRVVVRDYVPIFIGEEYRGHLWQYRDTTAEKRYQAAVLESERRKSATLETALDAIITIDETGRIVEWNPAAERLFGWNRDEMLGQAMASHIVPPEFRESHHAGFARLLETGQPRILGQRLELTALRRGGEVFQCELAITKLASESGNLFTAFMRDVSERIEGERKLREAKELAESASHAKSQFLATMSHEIRTPLNAILGMGELLAQTSLDTEQVDYLKTISTGGEALLALVNEFLDLAKIEAGEIEIESRAFRPAELIEGVLGIMRSRAAARAITLRSEIDAELPDLLVGDPNRIRQVLLNLMGNALKFTEQGEVRLLVDAGTLAGGDEARLRFAVRDTGVGIEPDAHSRVFEQFYQVDQSTARRYGGTGLGLAICRELSELMRGRVWLEDSDPSWGSEFRFELTLPLGQPSEDLPPPEPAGGGQAAPKDGATAGRVPLRILLAEDNIDNRRITERMLTTAGHSVDFVVNGDEILGQCDSHEYDLLVLDVEMPGCDGITATERLRRHETERGRPPVPIMALTAHALDDVRDRCLAAGMNDFLAKPASKRSLLSMVDQWAAPRPAVLVVDDSWESREVVRRFIDKNGRYRACWSSSGDEALQAVDNAAFALVLIDLEMPRRDGVSTTLEIRRRYGHGLPVIALSGHADPGARHRALEAGCDDYLVKPVRRETLLDAIDARLGRPIEASTAAGEPILVSIDPDIEDLLDDYLERRRSEVGEIGRLLAERRMDEIKRIGHNLKGTAGAYGIPSLGEVGAELEAAATASDVDRIESYRSVLADLLARVVADRNR